MFTRIAIATLAITALGAGAFAFSPSQSAPGGLTNPAADIVIEKNSAWPLKGYVTTAPCAKRACQDV